MFYIFMLALAAFAVWMIYNSLDDPAWGCDEYGRYHDFDGNSHLIEPYPFRDRPLRSLRMRIIFRWEIIRWWMHHGNKHETTRYCYECGWLLEPTLRDERTCTCFESIYEDDE